MTHERSDRARRGPTRRMVLAGGAAASLSGRGILQLSAKRPKVILELTRDAATRSVRAVERVIWVAR